MNKTAIFLDKSHDYDLYKDGDDYTFNYSHSYVWNSNIKGTEAFKVINDGNGLKITQNKKGRLDYSEAFLLYLALRMEYKDYDVEIGNLEKL